MTRKQGLAFVKRHGYTNRQIAKVVGKARNTVNEVLRLNTLPDRIKKEFRESDVGRTIAIEIAREKDSARQLSLWNKAKDTKLTVKTARAHKKGASPPPPAEVLLNLGKRFLKLLNELEPSKESTRQLTGLENLRKEIDKSFDRLV